MNQPGPTLFGRTLSESLGNAGALLVMQLTGFCVLAACSALVWLAGIKGIWGITLCFIVVAGLHIRKLRILNARHPVILKETGFVIGQTGNDFVPLESVMDIEYLGWAGWNYWFPAARGGRYGFKVTYCSTPSGPKSAFVFVTSVSMIQSEYKGQYLFRQAILNAVKDRKRKIWQAQQPGEAVDSSIP